MRAWVGVLSGVVALAAWAAAQPAAAQTYEQRFSQAQRELRRAEANERFTLAAERCRSVIASRDAGWMVVWCDLAAGEAQRNRNRDNRRDYNEAERALLWDAAWLQALEGIQDGNFFAAPLVERVSIADAESNQRLIAYRLVSALRTRDYRDIERYLRQLGELDGVAIGPADGLLVGRRRLLDALLAKPRTPERLWAIAATALTHEIEYRGTAITAADMLVDARTTAAQLNDLIADAEPLTGQDAALLPLIRYAQTKASWIARDYPAGQSAGEAGYEACIERLWVSASLCLDLGLEGAFARILGEFALTEPEMMMLPPDMPLTSRQRAVEYTEARCRAIVAGDVSDEGAFINVRVVYENPSRSCGRMALRYANERSYRPIAEATPGARRRNHLIRFVLTSP